MKNMCTVYLTVRNTSIGFCISNSAEWISVGYFLCWWLNQSHCGIISNSLFSPSQLELNSKHLYFRETFIKVFAKFSYSRQLIYILRKLYIKKYSSGKKSKYLQFTFLVQGPAPNSEPETMAVQKTILGLNKNIRVYITLHSYGTRVSIAFV